MTETEQYPSVYIDNTLKLLQSKDHFYDDYHLFTMFKEETIYNDKNELIGSYIAYLNVGKDNEVVHNYFIKKIKFSEELFNKILEKVQSDTVSILMEMIVEDNYKNQGYGTQLLEKFLNESKSPVLLIADVSSGSRDFLIDWYERKGFETIGHISFYPVMLKP